MCTPLRLPMGSEPNFKKTSAAVRAVLSLDELYRRRADTAARLVLMSQAGVVADADLDRVRASIADYDQRIARRVAKLSKKADRAMVKRAAKLDIPLATD